MLFFLLINVAIVEMPTIVGISTFYEQEKCEHEILDAHTYKNIKAGPRSAIGRAPDS